MTARRFPASLQSLLDALEHAGIPVVVLQQKGSRFGKAYANEPVVRQLGYTYEEWLEQPPFEAIAADQRTLIIQLYERLATEAQMPQLFELTLVHKDGYKIRAEFAASRSEIPDGIAFVLVQCASSPKSSAQLPLLEADRIALVGALAAGFAHETNNPLTSVLLNLRSLRKQVLMNLEDIPQQNALRCLDDITAGAERIANNVRALQTLATRSATQSIDLAAVVSQALRLAAPTLEPRAHVVRQISAVRAVIGEESRIGQAVLAMLLFSCSGFATDGDARDAATSERIVVEVAERQAGVVVEVSDNGCALTKDDVEHAFDPFFRSPARGAGVGVGLGIARSVASTLGGVVTLSPREGGGAVITMWLPGAPA